MENILNQMLGTLQRLSDAIINEIQRDKFLETPRAVGVTSAVVLTRGRTLLRGFYISNNNASTRYVKIYDANQPIAVGSYSPRLTLQIPGNASINQSFTDAIAFQRGIVAIATPGAADSDTTLAGAGEITINLFIQ